MDTSLFDYDLPPSAIAQVPADRRDQARLLVVDRASGGVEDRQIRELPEILPRTYRLVRNNASVLRARLLAQRPTGGEVECLLLQPAADPAREWWCLLRPGKKLEVGAFFERPGHFQARVEEKREDGQCRVRFSTSAGMTVDEIAERYGEMPLPPYIHRNAADPRRYLDNERYQTVYARPDRRVAVAAPTAGLHFTPELLAELGSQGHRFLDLTLHVGLGTFKPMQSESLEEHQMHAEIYEIPPETVAELEARDGPPLLAVGTTSLRALEDFYRHQPRPTAEQTFRAESKLFLYPPATFHTQALLTNFHLPRSTLLCLVSAYLTPGSTAGIDWLKDIYKAALDRGYRFYSYGDAMLIL